MIQEVLLRKQEVKTEIDQHRGSKLWNHWCCKVHLVGRRQRQTRALSHSDNGGAEPFDLWPHAIVCWSGLFLAVRDLSSPLGLRSDLRGNHTVKGWDKGGPLLPERAGGVFLLGRGCRVDALPRRSSLRRSSSCSDKQMCSASLRSRADVEVIVWKGAAGDWPPPGSSCS